MADSVESRFPAGMSAFTAICRILTEHNITVDEFATITQGIKDLGVLEERSCSAKKSQKESCAFPEILAVQLNTNATTNVDLVESLKKSEKDQQDQQPPTISTDTPEAVRALARESLERAKGQLVPDPIEPDDTFDFPVASEELPPTKTYKPTQRVNYETRLAYIRFAGTANEHLAFKAARHLNPKGTFTDHDVFWRWCAENAIDQGELDYAITRFDETKVPIGYPVPWAQKTIMRQRKKRTEDFGTIWPKGQAYEDAGEKRRQEHREKCA